MAGSEATNPSEQDLGEPLAKPAPLKDDSKLDLHSVSSALESNIADSIYNATRATSNNEDQTQTQTTGSDTLERADTRMAAKVAMFCSNAREDSQMDGEPGPIRPRRSADGIGRPAPAHLSDKLRTASTGEMTGWSLPDRLPPFHTKPSSSTGDKSSSPSKGSAAAASSSTKFPDNIKSPVSPTLPEFPAPVRSPTPPGVPSFGSPEARGYNFQRQAPPPSPKRGQSLLGRFFGSSSRTTSQPAENRQARTRLYAEDGTAITGSFPQRQSGHGASVMKGAATEHPYHQGNLPFAQTDGASAGPNDGVPEMPERAVASSTDTEGEAALRWFENAISQPSIAQPPAPAPTPASDASHSRQAIGHATRPDSYQTCRSQSTGPKSPWWPARYGRSALEHCSLMRTYSAIPVTPQDTETERRDSQDREGELSFWKTVSGRARAIFCCCCRPGESSQDSGAAGASGAATNTTTQDTYVTAREQHSNESQQHSPTETNPGPLES